MRIGCVLLTMLMLFAHLLLTMAYQNHYQRQHGMSQETECLVNRGKSCLLYFRF